ncbi:uncharacterized protein A4U43_C01F20810 [Asparagus officinalis]|uniref:tRNA (adenine(58)-N(1))-methyltransferase non-catalytic subunit TRM6 n=1 Tax=Asparagus officinalis TaxID=4686 RepID=A0A5P1FRI6_ASPOF|nr:uncharacterized protein A4U43_C01F20810 [Asparagus officinalis]
MIALIRKPIKCSSHVCSTYFGTKPPSLDIVRIFNFSNEVYRRILQAPFSVLSLSQNNVAISFEKDPNVQSFELHYNACNASLLPCSSDGVDDTHQSTSSLVQKPIPAGRQASSEDISFTSLIVAAPEMDVGSIIEDLLPLLSYYAPFAIYHQYLKVKDFTPCESSIYALMGKIHKRLNMHAKDMFYFGIALDLKPPASDVAAIKKVQQELNWLGRMLGLSDYLLESRLSRYY